MTLPVQSVEFWDFDEFGDGSLTTTDLARISSLFQDYKNLGVNTVTIGWAVPVDETTGSLVSSFSVPGVHAASLSEIRAIANVASQLGLAVILKPQANTKDATGTNGVLPDNVWSGDVGSGFNADSFLSQWATYMGSVGSLAQQVGASMVVVGTETRGFDTSTYRSQWINIINDTRQTYGGPLTYASFYDPNEVSFWDKLDVIGVDAWYGLTSDLNPTYPEVLSGWTDNPVTDTIYTLTGGADGSGPLNIVAKLQSLSAEYGKPLYFSEFGGGSFQGVVNNPAGPQPADQTTSWQQQEWLYQAMFQAMSDSNSPQWFEGVNMWAAYSNDPPENSSDFGSYLMQYPTNDEIRGKPAGLVAASWFGAKDYLAATDTSFTGSIANDQICLYGSNIASALQNANGQPVTQPQTFTTTVSFIIDGTILNGEVPTFDVRINGIDEGTQTLSNAPGTYIDNNGVTWTTNQQFSFTLSGLVNVSQFEIVIASPYNVGGVENAQTFVRSATIDGVALTNATYFPLVGSPRLQTIGDAGNAGTYTDGYTVFDATPWNSQLSSRNIGTLANPIVVNGGGGTDTVNALGVPADYQILPTQSGTVTLAENSGLNQNATLTGITYVTFQDGSTVDLTSLPSLLQEVQSAYLGVLRTSVTTAAADPAAIQIDDGQTTLPQFENGLIASEQAVYTTLPALVTIDAFYNATPSANLLTAVATATAGVSYYTAAELHDLGYSDTNVWTVLASGWGADPTSNFYNQYDSEATGTTAGYTAFIKAIYAREFGAAPSAANLANLLADVPGTQALLNGGGHVATPIQVMAGLYGYLLEVGQTDGIGQYAAATSDFLQAAANGTVTYGPELTAEFPPADPTTTAALPSAMTADTASAIAPTAAGPNIITVTGSDQLVDPGAGSYTIQFLTGTSGDTLLLRSGGEDRVAGFDPNTDALDPRCLLTGTGLDLTGNLSALSDHLTVADQGANALLQFNPTGAGAGSTIAVLQGLGGTATSVDDLVARGAIRLT
jgi:hypothetical protein